MDRKRRSSAALQNAGIVARVCYALASWNAQRSAAFNKRLNALGAKI